MVASQVRQSRYKFSHITVSVSEKPELLGLFTATRKSTSEKKSQRKEKKTKRCLNKSRLNKSRLNKSPPRFPTLTICPLDAIRSSEYGRKALDQRVIPWGEFIGFDDELSFNTQCSSQWDSLIHYAHQATSLYYNGFEVSLKDLERQDSCHHLPSLAQWHKRGSLVGRGVLIDYRGWMDSKGMPFKTNDTHKITIEDIEKVAKWQNVEFLPGDVLLIRSGYTEDLWDASPEEKKKLLGSGKCCGVENTINAARWFWNHRFAAVAGDMVGFEVCPPLMADDSEGSMSQYVLHSYLLAMFGMSIGELWDLSQLSKICRKKGRYSFLLTSCPLNAPGLVGSPPNALAIF